MHQSETLQLLTSLERGDFEERAIGFAPTVAELWRSICAAERSGVVTIRGADSFVSDPRTEPVSDEQLRAFVKHLDEQIQIIGAENRYWLDYEFAADHRRGNGGTAISVSRLLRGDVPVLTSVARVSYITLSDDSEDHESRRDADLYLLDRRDALAVSVFADVSRPSPHKPR